MSTLHQHSFTGNRCRCAAGCHVCAVATLQFYEFSMLFVSIHALPFSFSTLSSAGTSRGCALQECIPHSHPPRTSLTRRPSILQLAQSTPPNLCCSPSFFFPPPLTTPAPRAHPSMSVKDVSKKAAELEARLGGKLFLGGAKPTAEDVRMLNDLLGANHASLYRWVKNMATYTEGERKAWGAPVRTAAPELRMPAPAAAAPAAAKKPAPAPKAVAPAEDDDIDLFGETTEEEQAALEAKRAKDAEKKKAKKDVIAKSSILFDIKAWDDTVDLEALAQKLHAIQRDGLVWGDHKLAPVAFGVKKLQQLVVIEDDKVSGDDLEEMIMGFEDEVQSIDIVAWNKI
ncbi:translation elongation factor 1-beta, putative [Leishmania panamensis]|uniref:translation elongation factor 1-beta, putative n=1 Tax=Leishmania panamensis TaxID=5679 RepID=UPI0004F6243A|nr:translation elongation factor 1-beta, putative [Leishmania panamensis]AIN97579.1 translation elongation factor 1-beta, putative [Leishmania panamensis]